MDQSAIQNEIELDAASAAQVSALAALRGCTEADVIEAALSAYLDSLDEETRAQIERGSAEEGREWKG